MRKIGRLWVALFLMVMALMLWAASGCGKKETTIKTPEGEVTVGEKGDEITIKTGEGEVTSKLGKKPPSEEELGVPVYPNAEYDPEAGGGIATYQGEEEKGTFIVATYSVGSSFDEVVSWYKQKLGDPTGTFIAEIKQATWFKQEGNDSITVVVQEEKGKVTLTINRTSSQ